MDAPTKWVLGLVSLMVVIAIGYSAWKYLYAKQVTYLIETACDPASQNCFHRDCSSADSNCPPTNLEDYRVYRVRAADFEGCASDSCESACTSGSSVCTEVKCGETADDSCSVNPEKSAQ